MKILISGGGIAGLTLAYWLHRFGSDPLIVEKSSSLRDEGYMIDFFGSGYDVSEQMGILPELRQIHYPIRRLVFVDGGGSEKFSLKYDAIRRLFGGRHFNFMRGDLERLLYLKLQPHAPVRFATTIQSFTQDANAVHVKFSDGVNDSFDLLVGADGFHSHVRRLAFGEEARFSRFLGYHTATFIIHELNGMLRSADTDAFTTMTVPGRQAAIYPIRGGKLAAFLIHNAGGAVRDASFPEATQELQSTYGDMHWVVPEILMQPTPTNLYFDNVSQIVMERWSAGRVALLGDACQCVSLVAGQGASLAMAGAYVLADELRQSKGNVLDALSRYEERMKPGIEESQATGRKLARWFVPDNSLRLTVRDAFMQLSGWPVLSSLVRRSVAPARIPLALH